jgi:hypothetical protein
MNQVICPNQVYYDCMNFYVIARNEMTWRSIVGNEMNSCCEHCEPNPYKMATLPSVSRHDTVALLDAFTSMI